MRDNAALMPALKHTTAVRHLRQLTEALDDEVRLARTLEAEPTVVAAYASGRCWQAPTGSLATPSPLW